MQLPHSYEPFLYFPLSLYVDPARTLVIYVIEILNSFKNPNEGVAIFSFLLLFSVPIRLLEKNTRLHLHMCLAREDAN